MNELLTEITRAHAALQNLEIQPTKTNVTILMMAMQAMERAHEFIAAHTESETETIGGTADAGDKADS